MKNSIQSHLDIQEIAENINGFSSEDENEVNKDEIHSPNNHKINNDGSFFLELADKLNLIEADQVMSYVMLYSLKIINLCILN